MVLVGMKTSNLLFLLLLTIACMVVVELMMATLLSHVCLLLKAVKNKEYQHHVLVSFLKLKKSQEVLT
jgi:hypothetical protein